ncbi:hypothetical protein ACFQ1S_36630, partial [Kibdelosporangium lantanae]
MPTLSRNKTVAARLRRALLVTALACIALFALYDYTFRIPGVRNKEESLAAAYEAGIVCTDEHMLHPEPYPSIDAW